MGKRAPRTRLLGPGTRRGFRMATAAPKVRRLRLGPRSAGMLLTPEEFDRASGQEGWRYELINGVLVVSPTPSRQERDPNEELGHWLRQYQEAIRRDHRWT